MCDNELYDVLELEPKCSQDEIKKVICFLLKFAAFSILGIPQNGYEVSSGQEYSFLYSAMMR
jgi:hypothetical protein